MEEQHGPIFVVGMPRSGTTLVRLILNSHSRIAISPESFYLSRFWTRRSEFGDINIDSNLERLWAAYSSSKHYQDFAFPDDQAVKERLVQGERTHAAVFATLLQLYAQLHGKERAGEKTPGHLLFSQEILSWYPQAKIIHVVRDPRDLCASYRHVPWGSNNAFANARAWASYMEYVQTSGLGSSSHYFELCYEELCAAPEEWTRRLCVFLGEEYEAGMLEFYQGSEQFIEKGESWKNGVKKPMTKQNVGKWKAELTSSDIDQIVVKCGRFMLAKGYLTQEELPDGMHQACKSLGYHTLWLMNRVLGKTAPPRTIQSS